MAMPDLPLSDADQALLSVRADDFCDALIRGPVDDWSPFVEGLTGAIRVAVLTQLAVIDLAHRWERGDRPTAAEYVARFPELGTVDSPPPALRREEERCRAEGGPSAQATQHSNRAPAAQSIMAGRGADSPTRTVRASGPPPMIGGWVSGEGVTALPQEYELVRELGRGAFGEVWLARKLPSGIEKAIKVLHQPADQEAAQRELRSLELIKNLRHPYLLATEDFWVANNRLYVVSELADYSLRKRLTECKADGLPGIPDEELIGYMHEAAEGLDYLHAKMVSHRDVKPDNILVLNGHAKVCDFGLARQQQEQIAAMSFAGTPAYMAPEVWGGEGGPASDLYGFAVAYVELRQGSAPFKLGRVMDVMKAHLGGEFEFAEVIPERERVVLRRAMARDPAERHPSCLAFIEDLAAAIGRNVVKRSGRVTPPTPRTLPTPPRGDAGPAADTGRPGATLRDKPRPTAEPPAEVLSPEGDVVSRKKWWLLGTALLLLGLVGLGVWYLNRNPEPDSGQNGGYADGEITIPRGTTPEPGQPVEQLADGRTVPRWVVADGRGNGARFRLITPTGGAGTVRPFYISESKVWNGFYDAAGTAAGLPAVERGKPGGPDAPAVNLTANQAAAFAAAAFDGGRLPTPDEWDHAAGFHDRPNNPGLLRPGGDPRIGLSEPIPTHGPAAARALNYLDLIDMAGNGREWTSAVLVERGKPLRMVGGAAFEPKALVVLRGRNYTLSSPLTYEVLRNQQTEPQTQFADVPSPYTGFRVVLPLP